LLSRAEEQKLISGAGFISNIQCLKNARGKGSACLAQKDKESKMQVDSWGIKFLNVVMSDRFVNGYRRPSLDEDDQPIQVGYNSPFEHSDETRAQARFVVVDIRLTDDGGPRDGCTTITARRLHGNGSYNPKGELISFIMDGDGGNDLVIRTVDLVGRMELTFVPAE
jgi:hypothetical protein